MPKINSALNNSKTENIYNEQVNATLTLSIN